MTVTAKLVTDGTGFKSNGISGKIRCIPREKEQVHHGPWSSRYLTDVEELEDLHLEPKAGVHQQEHQVRHLDQRERIQ